MLSQNSLFFFGWSLLGVGIIAVIGLLITGFKEDAGMFDFKVKKNRRSKLPEHPVSITAQELFRIRKDSFNILAELDQNTPEKSEEHIQKEQISFSSSPIVKTEDSLNPDSREEESSLPNAENTSENHSNEVSAISARESATQPERDFPTDLQANPTSNTNGLTKQEEKGIDRFNVDIVRQELKTVLDSLQSEEPPKGIRFLMETESKPENLDPSKSTTQLSPDRVELAKSDPVSVDNLPRQSRNNETKSAPSIIRQTSLRQGDSGSSYSETISRLNQNPDFIEGQDLRQSKIPIEAILVHSKNGHSEMEIAKSLGVGRDEVSLVINLANSIDKRENVQNE